MSDDERMLNQRQIAAYLGVGRQAVKKWRGHTTRALRAAGQLDSYEPICLLPRNALPVPDNQIEHVRDGATARWRESTIDKWVDRTGRRDEVTGGFRPALPSGRKPDPNTPPRKRPGRTPAAPASAAAA